jgi:hypothetical protein
MRIHFPNSAFLGNIDPFIKNFDSENPEVLNITANKKWISVHPVVLSMVAALGSKIPAPKIFCEKLEAKSKHYLARMGLFSFLSISYDMKITEHESAGRFIPLTRIKNSDELTRFITDMVPLLHLEPKHAEPIKYVISELVRNVLEHANTPDGAIICAQYYDKSKLIRIGIADTGVGIKQSINFSHNAHTHLEAIKLALTPGITGTTRHEGGTEYNMGAGLFFIRSIAKVNRDFFMIYSGDSMYKLLKSKQNRLELFSDPFQERHKILEHLSYWNGTVVGIDISLEATKEFSKLLDLIRGTFVDTIRERRKEKYRKPRFI